MPDFSQFVLASFVFIGLVNGFNFLLEKEWKSFVKFMIAVAAGAVFGYLQWFGLPGIEMGLALGIASSGVYKGLQLVSGMI